jgi:predicted DNA-binding helix-hairpin-helix protein
MPGLPVETGAEGTPGAAPASDLRLAWLARRTCTSLAVREEAFARLMASEHRRGGFRRAAQRMRHACAPDARPRRTRRAHVAKFLDSADAARLFVTAEGKELVAVRAACPLPCLPRRALFWTRS